MTVTTMSRALKRRAHAAARCSATFECSEKSTGHTIAEELDMTRSLPAGDTLALTPHGCRVPPLIPFVPYKLCGRLNAAARDADSRPRRLCVLGQLQPGQPVRLRERGDRQWRARALPPCEHPARSLAPAVVAAQPEPLRRSNHHVLVPQQKTSHRKSHLDSTQLPSRPTASSTARARAEPGCNRRVDTCTRATTPGKSAIGTRS
jgi:hypothetical protein